MRHEARLLVEEGVGLLVETRVKRNLMHYVYNSKTDLV